MLTKEKIQSTLGERFKVDYQSLGGPMAGVEAIRICALEKTYEDGDCQDIFILDSDKDPVTGFYTFSDLGLLGMNLSCRISEFDWKEEYNLTNTLEDWDMTCDNGEFLYYWNPEKESIIDAIYSFTTAIKLIEQHVMWYERTMPKHEI